MKSTKVKNLQLGTVLVVDDAKLNRTVARAMLEMSGFRTLEARSGAQALTQIWECAPDLVITDIDMPGMNGIELIRQLRLTPALRLLPVIASSAGFNAEGALHAGADAFVGKPLIYEQLMFQVRRLLRAGRS